MVSIGSPFVNSYSTNPHFSFLKENSALSLSFIKLQILVWVAKRGYMKVEIGLLQLPVHYSPLVFDQSGTSSWKQMSRILRAVSLAICKQILLSRLSMCPD